MRRYQLPSGLRRGLGGTAGSNPAGGAGGCPLFAIFVCFKVEVFATDQSLVQWSPTGCGVSEFDRETS